MIREKPLYDLLVEYLPNSDFKISNTSLYVLKTIYSDNIINKYLLSHGLNEKFKTVNIENENNNRGCNAWYKIKPEYKKIIYEKF